MASSTPARPPTPGRSPPPVTESAAFGNSVSNTTNNIPNPQAAAAARRTSLGFLRRAKSTEPLGDRKSSGGRTSKKMMKEQAREEELRRKREAAAVPKIAPRLPDLSPTPQLKTFGGESARPDSFAIVSNRLGHYQSTDPTPIPPIPAPAGKPTEQMDPYARTESMTHRGRYSYASSAVSTINSPRRVRRRKDPTPYNILVIGARSSGKTSFLNFLRASLALPPSKRPTRNPEELEIPPQSMPNSNFVSHYLETEIDSERVGLTLWDSQALDKNVVDLQLREITSFLESKFEDSFAEEMKVVRAPGVRDTHIHCAFLILDPARLDANIEAAEKQANGKQSSARIVGGLDEELDLQILRTMQNKTTVVPIISKADTITTAHMAFLKQTVWDSLKKANIDPLEVLTLDDQETSSSSSINTFDEQDEDDMSKDEDEAEAEAEAEAETETADEDRRTPDSDTVPENTDDPRPSSNSRVEEINKRISLSTAASANVNSDPPFIPLSILSPDPHTLNSKDEKVGRRFPWGFADPYDPEHCDFLKVKDTVFGEWRAELREASREVWYEKWRTSRLNRQGNPSANINNGMRGVGSGGGRVTR